MTTICQWIASMCKPRDYTGMTDYYARKVAETETREKQTGRPCDMKEYYKRSLAEAIPEEIKILRRQLNTALQERKTCTESDWEHQLGKVLEAQTALAQMKSAGMNCENEMSAILNATFQQEFKRLKFLSFSPIDLPEDVIQDILDNKIKNWPFMI
jgi:hypothetical protein